LRREKLGLLSTGTRGRVAAGVALLVAVGIVVYLVLSSGSPSSAASSGGSKASGATTVERRNLVETDTESGTLSYASPQTVYNRLSGAITWLPSVGQVIKPGGTLYDVSGEPVVLMDGSTPAYRELDSSDSAGPDVLQLNRNLVNLGFDPDGIVIDDEWQAATTAGVDQWQASLGETETGSIGLGQVVFLPGDQLISTVVGTLGANASTTVHPSTEFVSLEQPATRAAHDASASCPSTTTTTSTSTPTTTTATTTTATTTTATTTTATTTTATTDTPTNDVATTTTPSTPACPTTTPSRTKPESGKKHKPSSQNAQTLAALIALLKAESAELKAAQHSSTPSGTNNAGKKNSGSKSPTDKSSNPSSSGSPASDGGSADAVLDTTSTQLVVTVDLSASVQSEAVVGEPVTVEMPAGNTVNGKITAVSPVAQSSSSGDDGSGSGGSGNGGSGNSGSGATIPVTVTLKGHVSGAGLDQASVSVNFAEAKANNVLSVPVTALLAVSGGNYAVQEAQAPFRLIPVTTGLFAAGYVQISGSGIYPGLQVTDSQG
jgi:hypothetical protein